MGHKFEPCQITILIRNMITGLNHCHRLDIIHGDIKPSNIMINPNTLEIKYIDFGLACTRSPPILIPSGTLLYKAPELVLGYTNDVDTLLFTQLTMCEYWSLGLTMIELLTMKPLLIIILPMVDYQRIVDFYLHLDCVYWVLSISEQLSTPDRQQFIPLFTQLLSLTPDIRLCDSLCI